MKVIWEFEAYGLGKQIKEARIKKGYSIREMERRTGINYVVLWEIEKEKRNIKLETLQKIDSVLETNLSEELYDGS